MHYAETKKLALRTQKPGRLTGRERGRNEDEAATI